MKQRYNITIEQLSILIILIIFSIIPITLVFAAMSSDNFKIDADSINIGGSQSNSANYRMEDTVGEMGTSESASGSYIMRAGYQAMVNDTDPTLSFNVTDNTVALGILSLSEVKTDTAQMTAGTNATGGYSITVFGPTLTSGSDTITKIGGTHAASNPGVEEQFGMKIAESGGSGVVVDPYDDANEYAYDGDVTADECANSASNPSLTTTFTMTYMANITATTAAGSYSATHTYICTGTF